MSSLSLLSALWFTLQYGLTAHKQDCFQRKLTWKRHPELYLKGPSHEQRFSPENWTGSSLKKPTSLICVRWASGLQHSKLLTTNLLPWSVLLAHVGIGSVIPHSYDTLTYLQHHRLNVISKGFAWLKQYLKESD